jgi:hypothetical protein
MFYGWGNANKMASYLDVLLWKYHFREGFCHQILLQGYKKHKHPLGRIQILVEENVILAPDNFFRVPV